MVDRETGHKTTFGARVPGRSLNRRRIDGAPGNVELVPPYRRLTVAAALDSMTVPERLYSADIRILILHHQARSQRIQVVAAAFGNGAGCARPCAAGVDIGGAGKWGIRRVVPVHVKLPH